MEKTITIKEVNKFKEGNTNGRDWAIYKVKCSGDNEMSEFSTFNDYGSLIGQQYKTNFEYNSKFKNWQEVSEAKAKESSKHEEIMNALRNVFSKLDDIEKKLDK